MAEQRADDPDAEENDDEFYIQLMERTIATFSLLLGEKTALIAARKAPITITPDNTITGYYGTGKRAFDVLIQQYESVFGSQMADRKVRNSIRDMVSDDEKDRVPDRVRPPNEHEKISIWEQLRRLLPTP